MKINNINNQYNNTYSPNVKNNKNINSPAFKGAVPQPVVNGLSKFYTGVASKKGFQNFIKNFSKSDKTFTHVMVAESCFLSGFYMINTLRNKKIAKEQKPQMLINDTLTLGVSTAGAYLAEDKITNVVNKMTEKYILNHKDFYQQLGQKTQQALGNSPKQELLSKVGEVISKNGDDLAKGLDDVSVMMGKHLKNLVGEEGKLKSFQITQDKLKNLQDTVKNVVSQNKGSEQKAKEAVKGIVDDIYNASAARSEADKILPGFNKLKVLIIFGIIYRYLGPVIITPIANKLSSKLFKKDEKKA